MKEAVMIWRNKACPCGCGLDNVSDALIERIRTIEEIIKDKVLITSAARCAKYNAQIGGAGNSAHLRGLAVDIACGSSYKRWQLLVVATTVGITRIGCGKTFIHIDIDDSLPAERVWLY